MRRILTGSSAEVNLAAIAVFPGIILGIFIWRCATGNWVSFSRVASILTMASAVVLCGCLVLAPRRSLVVAAPIGFVGVKATMAGLLGRGAVFWFVALGCLSIVCLLALLDAKLMRKVGSPQKSSDGGWPNFRKPQR